MEKKRIINYVRFSKDEIKKISKENNMSEQSFKDSIFEVAKNLKGFSLTDSEKQEIISNFNSSTKTSSAEKAREAIEKVLGKKLPDKKLILEKAASATLDNLDRLLLLMQSEADKWDAK